MGFFCCITFVKWFIIILLIGNSFNVIANEGLMVNDLQKFWILRRTDDIVSGLLIVVVWYYVLFPLVLHYVLLLLDQ